MDIFLKTQVLQEAVNHESGRARKAPKGLHGKRQTDDHRPTKNTGP